MRRGGGGGMAGWRRPVKKTLPEKQASQSVGVTVIRQADALLMGVFLELGGGGFAVLLSRVEISFTCPSQKAPIGNISSFRPLLKKKKKLAM